MKKLLSLVLLMPMLIFAQKGMQFEHDLSWKQILAKAKAENKYIFMDAFTTWCGPCRYMSENIFPMENVGTYYNKNFINVKVQLDSTAKDNDYVKSWYTDGHNIMNDYKIRAFPTYLFFAPDGKVVHRVVGSSDAETFITKGTDALNPEKQYYVLIDQYKAGKKDPDFLRKVALAASASYDANNSSKISNEYLSTQKDLLTKENIDFIDQFTTSSKDLGFTVIINHPQEYDAVKGIGKAHKKVVEIIKSEEIYPQIFMTATPNTDWVSQETALSKKYPAFSKEAILSSKVMFYQSKADWPGFQSAVQAYMKDYGANVSAPELNDFAWTVFENCKDMTCVKEALEWSKKSFKDREDPAFLDTYANIIYKLGNKEEAIKWEEKALALSSDKKSYQEVLDKMKKGEKTWKD